MSEAARYAVRDGVAVITLDNPPVNGLGNALRAALLQHLKKADADPAVKAVVLIGSAKAFSGGADIREFNAPRLKPDLPEVNDARRPGARARLPLPHLAAAGAARAAGSEARHPARLGRHATPAAHRAHGRGREDDDQRQSDSGRESEGARPGR